MKALHFFASPRFVIGLSVWQHIVLFTPISLYGYWTDIVMCCAWLGLLGYVAWSGGSAITWLRWVSGALIGASLILVLMVTSSIGGLLFAMNSMGGRTVPQEDKVQGTLLVNQYFIPVGAPGCGMGQLITAKALVFFPLIEYRTEYDPCTHEDWAYLIEHGSWEGYSN